jgi:hypothetical protein
VVEAVEVVVPEMVAQVDRVVVEQLAALLETVAPRLPLYFRDSLLMETWVLVDLEAAAEVVARDQLQVDQAEVVAEQFGASPLPEVEEAGAEVLGEPAAEVQQDPVSTPRQVQELQELMDWAEVVEVDSVAGQDEL